MNRTNLRCFAAILLVASLVVALPYNLAANNGNPENGAKTTTPIKYLVVIFQENESFDHYFGTYPHAANLPNETPFFAEPNTPAVNGLNNTLLVNNPNGPTNVPFRLDPSQAYTCDQKHGYTFEQQAFDSGLMDKFPEFTATACSSSTYPSLAKYGTQIVMGYYDGNTTTALWNYAQFFAMSDNFHGTTFGPSAVGAVNLASGMTGNTDPAHTKDDAYGDLASDVVNGTMIGDPDPWYEDCVAYDQTALLGKNIGDLLNAKHVSWGWFQGGFTPSAVENGVAQCNTTTNRLDGTPETAYAGYHNPFQFYASTNNQHHIAPQNIQEVGHHGPANHIYDLSLFQKAAFTGNLPSVSFLKAARAQDGHPANSSPLDEQVFLVSTINFLQALPQWNEMAVIIAWDDSDGWYDHVLGPIVNQSATSADALSGPTACGTGANSLAGIQARCGYGPRLPLVVVSPYAKQNFVDSTISDQSSITRFIEDNWGLGRIGAGSYDAIAGTLTNMFDFTHQRHGKVLLSPSNGRVVIPIE